MQTKLCSYLLLQLNHLLLLNKQVTESILIRVGHQSVSVVGAQLRENTQSQGQQMCTSTRGAFLFVFTPLKIQFSQVEKKCSY